MKFFPLPKAPKDFFFYFWRNVYSYLCLLISFNSLSRIKSLFKDFKIGVWKQNHPPYSHGALIYSFPKRRGVGQNFYVLVGKMNDRINRSNFEIVANKYITRNSSCFKA